MGGKNSGREKPVIQENMPLGEELDNLCIKTLSRFAYEYIHLICTKTLSRFAYEYNYSFYLFLSQKCRHF